MPGRLRDYTLFALELSLSQQEFDVGGVDEEIIVRRSDNEYIDDYECIEYSYGVTRVSYTRAMRPEAHIMLGISTLGLSVPFTVAADIAMRAGLGKHTYYFDTKTEDMLGDDQNKAAERANDIGNALMTEKRYDEACTYFDMAYNLCTSGYKNESEFKWSKSNAQKCAEEEKKWEERESRKRAEREAKERSERESRESAERKAGEIFLEAVLNWKEGFVAERQNNSPIAKWKFERCYDLFYQLFSLDRNNRIYEKWVNISALKIKGDDLFNEAVVLHEEANELYQYKKYEEARKKYCDAKTKYQEGFDKSNDSRFKDCIEMVDKCILATKKGMENTRLEVQTQRAQFICSSEKIFLTKYCKDHTGKLKDLTIFHTVLDS